MWGPTLVIGAIAAVVAVVANLRIPIGLDQALPLAVFLVMGAASAGLRTRGGEEHVAFSFTGVALVAAIPLVGPAGAALVGLGTAMLDARHRWTSAHLFNAAMLALMAAAGGAAYRLSGGAFVIGGSLQVPGASGLDLAAGTLVRYVGVPCIVAVSAVIVANVGVLLLVRTPAADEVRGLLMSSLTFTLPLYLGYGVIAFLLVVLWVPGRVGALSAALITAPLLVTRWIHTQYADQKRAHRRILEALVHAGTGPEGAAHAERVGGYADAIGGVLGLRAKSRHDLKYAAMLHGIGDVDGCRLDPTGDPEVARVAAQTRATAAYEVVSHVDFLADAAQAVRYQGERFDGSGGPDGLAGDAIPLLARILAVSDAADLLIEAPGSGLAVHDAVDVLARRPDRFDPEVVAALGQALGRRESDVLRPVPPRGSGA